MASYPIQTFFHQPDWRCRNRVQKILIAMVGMMHSLSFLQNPVGSPQIVRMMVQG